MSHGWVDAEPGSPRARCGGPPLCTTCMDEIIEKASRRACREIRAARVGAPKRKREPAK